MKNWGDKDANPIGNMRELETRLHAKMESFIKAVRDCDDAASMASKEFAECALTIDIEYMASVFQTCRQRRGKSEIGTMYHEALIEQIELLSSKQQARGLVIIGHGGMSPPNVFIVDDPYTRRFMDMKKDSCSYKPEPNPNNGFNSGETKGQNSNRFFFQGESHQKRGRKKR